MNSTEFDQPLEEGASVLDSLDIGAARRPRLEQRRVNVDFPLCGWWSSSIRRLLGWV